jgi:hypothetical protein
LRHYLTIFLDRLRTKMKISVSVIGGMTKIKNGHFQNTSQKYYGLSQLAQNLGWKKIINPSIMSSMPHKHSVKEHN